MGNLPDAQWITQIRIERSLSMKLMVRKKRGLLSRKRAEDTGAEYEDEEGEEEGEEDEEAQANDASDAEEEDEEPKQESKEFRGSVKRKGFESDEDCPPGKTTACRRMAVVYDSAEE